MAGVPRISEDPTIRVRQPQLYDIVDDPVKVCGIGTGFEGVFSARVRDGQGADLGETMIHTSAALGNFQVELGLQSPPATAQDMLSFSKSRLQAPGRS